MMGGGIREREQERWRRPLGRVLKVHLLIAKELGPYPSRVRGTLLGFKQTTGQYGRRNVGEAMLCACQSQVDWHLPTACLNELSPELRKTACTLRTADIGLDSCALESFSSTAFHCPPTPKLHHGLLQSCSAR